jgi:hypothetical protein
LASVTGADEEIGFHHQRGPRARVAGEGVIKALRENWIAGAAADVFEEEPTAHDNPLLSLETSLEPLTWRGNSGRHATDGDGVEDVVAVFRQGTNIRQPAEICPTDGTETEVIFALVRREPPERLRSEDLK